MALLLLGLVLFLGVHAVTMARTSRAKLIQQFGEGGYKAAYSLLSLAGFVLIVWGFVVYREGGYVPVWTPPVWMAHLTLALMLPAIILLFVFLLPNGRLKSAVQHPMLAMVKIWAFAHLLANGDLGSILLFGSFLAYAVIDRISIKRRGGARLPAVGWNKYDGMSIVLGVMAYLAIAFYLHPILFGVPVIAARV